MGPLLKEVGDSVTGNADIVQLLNAFMWFMRLSSDFIISITSYRISLMAFLTLQDFTRLFPFGTITLFFLSSEHSW